MNARHRRIVVLLTVVVAGSVGLYLARPMISRLHLTEIAQKRSDGVIVIKTTDACQCALERCGEVEETVRRTVVRVNPDARLEIIDYAEEPHRANSLMQKFDAYLIPVVLVIGDEEDVIYRSEWDLDEPLLAKAIEALDPEVE